MPSGPGKYDALCTYVRERTEALGVVLIVINGNKGSGHSVQLMLPADAERDPRVRLHYSLQHAGLLREIATQVETISYREAGVIPPTSAPTPAVPELQFKNAALDKLARLARQWHKNGDAAAAYAARKADEYAEETGENMEAGGIALEALDYCASLIDGVFGELGEALVLAGITPQQPPQTPPPVEQP